MTDIEAILKKYKYDQRWYEIVWSNIGYFFNNIRCNIESFFCGVSNIVKFMPIIYKDRDYDWTYLTELMRFKIDNMRKFHATSAHYIGTEHNVKRLRVIAECLNRIANKDYSFEHYDKLEKKYGDKLWNNDNRGDAINKEINNMLDRESYMEKQDMELFVQYFKRYLKHFWD